MLSEDKLRDHYAVGKFLGAGQFGQVFLAQKKSCPEKVFVIKRISHEFSDPSEYRYVEREIRILLEVDHPNIVKIVEVYKDQGSLYLVMEYCQGNDLQQEFDS